MTESMRSNDEPPVEPAGIPAGESEIIYEVLDPYVVVGQFLTQCRHAQIAPREELATFILTALNGPSSDEWTQALRAQLSTADDDRFESLLASDPVFLRIYDMLLKSKGIVGRGESMSLQRKALIQLMDLRVGESFDRDRTSDESRDEAWEAVLGKLFPELL